jgi:hypothetical protein
VGGDGRALHGARVDEPMGPHVVCGEEHYRARPLTCGQTDSGSTDLYIYRLLNYTHHGENTCTERSQTGSCEQESRETSPGRKKKRKKKDPNAPKRAQSAYLLFMGSVRADVVSQFPNYKIGEIAQHIGGMWRALPAKIKAPFERRAAELRAQYLEDRRVYLLNKTDPNKPKRLEQKQL